jgi:hypothetical protein
LITDHAQHIIANHELANTGYKYCLVLAALAAEEVSLFVK